MLRCCNSLATDPLLRRPFFIHSVQRKQGLCTLLIYVRGRGTSWLVEQQEGATLDILGPLGHGWQLRPSVRNLLLVSEGTNITALTLLAQTAIEQELAVTLISLHQNAESIYPPTLLPPEVEYHILTQDGSLGQREESLDVLSGYLNWADAACCSVSHETLIVLYNRFARLRTRHFAQGLRLQPLVCGTGVCLACSTETYTGQKLICQHGPVFELQEIAR